MTNLIVTIVVLLILIVLGPFLFIWSLDTLFPVLDIPYTLETWVASFLLTATLAAKAKK